MEVPEGQHGFFQGDSHVSFWKEEGPSTGKCLSQQAPSELERPAHMRSDAIAADNETEELDEASATFGAQRTCAKTSSKVFHEDGLRGERELTLEGNAERTVYTYDPKPLKGTRKGSVFYADVIFERTKLVSPSTGGEWDTDVDGGVALARNGKPFGMMNTLTRTFRELEGLGYSVKVKRTGMYDKVIPLVVLQIPEPDEVFFWRDVCHALGREVPFERRHDGECELAVECERQRRRLSRATQKDLPPGVDGEVFFFEDSVWTGPRPGYGTAELSISTTWMPTPKGSSAKPHISVMLSGEEILDLSARSVGRYRTMSEHVGQSPLVATVKRYKRDDGTFCWMVAVVYAPKE